MALRVLESTVPFLALLPRQLLAPGGTRDLQQLTCIPQYLKAGLLVQSVDTAEVVTDYGYDHLRRKNLQMGRDHVATIQTYITGSTRIKEVLEQDASSVPHEVLELAYDSAGRVSRRIERNTREGSAKDEIFDFTCNKLGQVTYESGSGAFPLVSQYDLQGRLVLREGRRGSGFVDCG